MTDDERPSAKNIETIRLVPEPKQEVQVRSFEIPKDFYKSHDTQGEDCGISPLQIRGWPKLACRWHDSAYSEGSWHEGNMSRYDVDRAFLRQLLTLSGNHIGKRILSYGMYYVARLFGARFWEGEKQ